MHFVPHQEDKNLAELRLSYQKISIKILNYLVKVAFKKGTSKKISKS